MRKEAGEMFGASFSKPFLIRSPHDAVHLLTKAKFGGLTPSATDKRLDAASELADKAKTLASPLAQPFSKASLLIMGSLSLGLKFKVQRERTKTAISTRVSGF
jgi:hypothetical protein